jgi:hypothetical protein
MNVPVAEMVPHATFAIARPGVVRPPVRHVHSTWPEGLALRGTRPEDRLASPLGRITVKLHIAFGVVRAIRLASVPACTGEVSEVMTTPRALADVLAEAGPPTREMTAPAAATAVRILTVLNMIGFVPLRLMSPVAADTGFCGRSLAF